MIYENITFQVAPFFYKLSFDDRITLVGGDSGTGKTVLYNMLEDLRLTEQYHAIKLFNYKSDQVVENIKKCRNCFIVMDNADILIMMSFGNLLILSFRISICFFEKLRWIECFGQKL